METLRANTENFLALCIEAERRAEEFEAHTGSEPAALASIAQSYLETIGAIERALPQFLKTASDRGEARVRVLRMLSAEARIQNVLKEEMARLTGELSDLEGTRTNLERLASAYKS